MNDDVNTVITGCDEDDIFSLFNTIHDCCGGTEIHFVIAPTAQCGTAMRIECVVW